MKTIVKIEMHPQNSCPLFSYPYACLHLSSTVFWNQNNPWFSYPYAISVLYSSTPMLSRGTRLGVQRYENIVDDGTPTMFTYHLPVWVSSSQLLFSKEIEMTHRSLYDLLYMVPPTWTLNLWCWHGYFVAICGIYLIFLLRNKNVVKR